MNIKMFHKLLILTIGLLTFCSISAWGTDVEFLPASDQTFPKDGITISVSSGTLTNGTDYRVYKNATMTISSTVGNITNIALTYSSTSYDGGGWSASYQPNAASWTSPTANGEQARITKIVVTVSSGTSPSISTSGSLTAFTSVYGSVSSTQYFSVSGSYLTGNITVTAPTNYELSKTTSGTYSSSVEFAPTDGTISSNNVYIRLKNNINAGTIDASEITVSSTDATSRKITIPAGKVQCKVVWSTNGSTTTAGSPTSSVDKNSKVSVLPTNPDPCMAGKTFVGWTNATISDGNKPGVLFKDASGAPSVSTNEVTYYAVFATSAGTTTLTETVGFESTEGYTATSTYNSSNYTTGSNGSKWTINYGAFATSGAIVDSQSAQFRVYSAGNYGQLRNTVAYTGDIAKVVFSAKVSNANSTVKVSYSANGTSWNDIETHALTTTTAEYTSTVPVSGAKYIKFTAGGDKPSSGNYQIYIDAVKIYSGNTTYSDYVTSCSTTVPDAPTITVNSSNKGYATVTIIGTGSIYYTIDGTTPTTSSTEYSSEVRFPSPEANTVGNSFTIKAIAVDGGTSAVSSETVTITPLDGLADMYAAAGSSENLWYRMNFGKWYISQVSGYRAWVTDGAGRGFTIEENHGFQMNDQFTNALTINGSLQKKNEDILLSNSNNMKVANLPVTSGQTVPVIDKTIATLTDANQAGVYKLTGVVYDNTSGTVLKDAGNSVTYYDTYQTNYAMENGRKYDVTGVYVFYNNSGTTLKEFSPRTEADIKPYCRVTYNVNGGVGAPSSDWVLSGNPVSQPTDPTKSGFTFAGWYEDEACTQAWDFNTNITTDKTLYASWTQYWYYHEAWTNDWGANQMTESADHTYWYWYTFASSDNREFKVQKGGTWYGRDYNTPGFNCTDISNMNSGSNTWNTTDSRCAVNYNGGRYYIIVYVPNTAANPTSDPVVCASTYLPTATSYSMDAAHTVYFDNSSLNWSSVYFRIGRTCHNRATVMDKVAGTANLYKAEVALYQNYYAYNIANNNGWTDVNSIYLTKTNDTHAITAATAFEQSTLNGDVTIVPTDAHSTGADSQNNNCEFYGYKKTSGMLTHNVTIGSHTNGTIKFTYTDVAGNEHADVTTGTSNLAHTCILTISAVPNTGYELTALTVNGEAFTSGNTHILSADATIAATFSPITYTITYQELNGATNSNPTSYNIESATINLANPGARDGFAFNGWTCDGNSITQIASGSTGDKTITATWATRAQHTITLSVPTCATAPASTSLQCYDGDAVMLPNMATLTINEVNYTFVGWYEEQTDAAGTTTAPTASKLHTAGSWSPSQTTTLYALYKAIIGGTGTVTWNLVTDIKNVTEGQYIFINAVSTNSTATTGYYCPSNKTATSNNTLGGSTYTISTKNSAITSDVTAAMTWTFSGDNTTGFTIKGATNYLGSYIDGSNYGIRETSNNTTSKTDYTWIVTSVTTAGQFQMHTNGDASGYYLYYRSSSKDYRIYSGTSSSSGSKPYLFKRTVDGTTKYFTNPCNQSVTVQITLDNQGATTAGTANVDATQGQPMPNITVPEKTHYTFGGYYTETNGNGTKYYNADGTSNANSTFSTATTLYAKWTENAKYSVTWSVNGNETLDAKTYYADEKVSGVPTAPTSSDCDDSKLFVGWSSSEVSDGNKPAVLFRSLANAPAVGAANVTYYAVFANSVTGTYEKKTTKIEAGDKVLIYNPNSTFAITNTAGTKAYSPVDGLITGVAAADNTEWTVGASGTYFTFTSNSKLISASKINDADNIIVASSPTYYAWTVVAKSTSWAMHLSDKNFYAEYSSGWKTYYTSTPGDACTFDFYVQKYINYATSCTKPTPTGLTLSGKYATTFDVNDTYSHEGMIVTASFDNGEQRVVTDAAQFSSPDMSTEGTKTITVSYNYNSTQVSTTYDITVRQPFTVTYNTNGATGTTPTADQSKYYAGDTFEAAAQGDLLKTGSDFGGWSDGVTVYAAGATVTIATANKTANTITLTAVWNAKQTAVLTLSANGNESTFDAGNTHYVGDEVTLPTTATLAVGYGFLGWSTVEIPTPTSRPDFNYYPKGTAFTLTRESQTIYAVYARGTGATTTYDAELIRESSEIAAGGKYIIERDGYVAGSVISGGSLSMTNAYTKDHLTGTEAYVWTLEEASDGKYKMRNMSVASAKNYLRNTATDKPDLAFLDAAATGNSWSFTYQDATSSWDIRNGANDKRYLAQSSAENVLKAYTNSVSYPHNMTFYRLYGDYTTSPDAGYTVTIEIDGVPAATASASASAGATWNNSGTHSYKEDREGNRTYSATTEITPGVTGLWYEFNLKTGYTWPTKSSFTVTMGGGSVDWDCEFGSHGEAYVYVVSYPFTGNVYIKLVTSDKTDVLIYANNGHSPIEYTAFQVEQNTSANQCYLPDYDCHDLKGFYTDPADGVMIYNAEGQMQMNVDGYTSSTGWNYKGVSPLQLYAQWEDPKNYTATFVYGTDAANHVISDVACGSTITPPANPAACSGAMTFMGWTISDEATVAACPSESALNALLVDFDTYLVKSDVTFHAVWKKAQRTFQKTTDNTITNGTYLIVDNTTASPSDVNALSGTMATMPKNLETNGTILSNESYLMWTIAAVSGGYTVRNAEGYLNITANNTEAVTVQDASATLKIEESSTNGLYIIYKEFGSDERHLTYDPKTNIWRTMKTRVTGYLYKEIVSSNFVFTFNGECAQIYRATEVRPITSTRAVAAKSVEGRIIVENDKGTKPVAVVSGADASMFSVSVSDAPLSTNKDGSKNYSYTVTYTPTAYDAIHSCSIVFQDASPIGAGVVASDPVLVRGRSLPEHFAIVANLGTELQPNYVALRGDMSALQTPQPLMVERDGSLIVINEAHAYSLGVVNGYAAGSDYRNTEAVWLTSPTGRLWIGASGLKNVTDAGSNWAAQALVLETADLETYHISSKAGSSEALMWHHEDATYDRFARYSSDYFDYLNYNGDFYLLPIAFEAEGKEMDIVDWTDNKVVLNVSNLNPNLTLTASVAGGAYGAALTRNADRTVDIATSTLTPDNYLQLAVKLGDNVVSNYKYKIPHIVTANTNSSSLSLTSDSYILVKSGRLTIDNNLSVKGIYVYPGAELLVDEGRTLSAHKIVLRGDAWTHPSFKHVNATVKANEFYYTRRISDKTHFYQLGVPYAVAQNTEKLSNGTNLQYMSGWTLKYYNAADRAQYGKDHDGDGSNNWEYVNPTGAAASAPTTVSGPALEAGKGYEFWSNSNFYREYYFPFQTGNTGLNSTNNVLSIAAPSGAAATANPIHGGWNYLVSPLTYSYRVSDVSPTSSDPADALKLAELYEDGQNYYQYPALNTTIRPFAPFYFQASTTGTMTFNSNGQLACTATPTGAAWAPRRSLSASVRSTQWLQIAYTSSATQLSDQTNIYLNADRFTEEYETGFDVVKLATDGSRPTIYTAMPCGNLAFAALPDTIVGSRIPISVFSTEEAAYTFSLIPNDYMGRLEHVYLVDDVLNFRVDLMSMPFVYDASEGTTAGRFFILPVYRTEVPAIPTDVDDMDTGEEPPYKIIYDNKVFIIRGGHVYDSTGKFVK